MTTSSEINCAASATSLNTRNQLRCDEMNDVDTKYAAKL